MTRKPDENDILIGANIKRQRNKVGMTQTGLAGRLGMSFQQMQKIERGINRCSGGRLVRIAAIIGCDLLDLFESCHPLQDKPREKTWADSKQGIEHGIVMASLSDKEQAAIIGLALGLSGEDQ
jgi:transcriptional regulator with XRE-family HTH domain